MSLTERMPALVGVITLAAGTLLAAAPHLTTKPLGLEGQETPMRLVGLADLALVPGLLRGEPRWPWMFGRAALNLGQAAYFHGVADRSSSPGLVRGIDPGWRPSRSPTAPPVSRCGAASARGRKFCVESASARVVAAGPAETRRTCGRAH